MKASDVMKTQVKWLKDRCKLIKKEMEQHKLDRSFWYEDYYEGKLESKLDECVAIMIATEKYMKKLRHEGN